MSSRLTWFWLLIAGGLLAFISFYEIPNRHKGSKPQRILPDLKTESVTSIEVLPKGLDSGIRAERGTNGQWFLTKPIRYAAEATNTEALLLALKGLTSDVLPIKESDIARRPQTEQSFGFTDPQATVIINPNGPHLRIGRKTEPGDQVYLQVVGREGVYYVVGAGLLDLLPQSTNDWRNTALLEANTPAFDRVSVTNGARILELQHHEFSGLWQLNPPGSETLRADSPKIETALRLLLSTRISQFLSDDPKMDLEPFGLQPAELNLGLSQGSNSVVVFQFGKTNGAGQLYARRVGQPGVFTIPQESIELWRLPVGSLRAPCLVSLPRLPASIQIIQGADTNSVVMQTNASWQVLPQGFSADSASVSDLLTNLSTMAIAELVIGVATPPVLAEKGLAPPSRQYVLRWTANGGAAPTNAHTVCLQFGATNTANQVFARRTEELCIYSVNLADFQRLPAAGWQLRQRRIWDFSIDEVASVITRSDGKTNQLVHVAANAWASPPLVYRDPVKLFQIESTVRPLGQLSAVAWVGHGAETRPRLGFKDTDPQVTIELRNQTRLTVDLGPGSLSGLPCAAVTLDGEPWVFEMDPLLYRDVIGNLSP